MRDAKVPIGYDTRHAANAKLTDAEHALLAILRAKLIEAISEHLASSTVTL
jgi:hypothetical protein